MRLVVDTSVLVDELLRVRGRERLGDQLLELFLPEAMWEEAAAELPRRIAAFATQRGLDQGVTSELTTSCLTAIKANVAVIDAGVYSALEDEARARSLRDAADWPVIACALALSAGVWTNNNDSMGTGVPTWTTQSLQAWLDRQTRG
ncbi:MAG: PIN domain-containing protein [Egibacteraceae bacterium]